MKLHIHPKLQRCNRWILGMDKWLHPTLYCACDYLSMLELKLIHVSKWDLWWQNITWTNDKPVYWCICRRIYESPSPTLLLAVCGFFHYGSVIIVNFGNRIKLKSPVINQLAYNRHFPCSNELISFMLHTYILIVGVRRTFTGLDRVLTHWGRDTVDAIFADDIVRCIFVNELIWLCFGPNFTGTCS